MGELIQNGNCWKCKGITATGFLSQFGGMCRHCFGAYCVEKPKPLAPQKWKPHASRNVWADAKPAPLFQDVELPARVPFPSTEPPDDLPPVDAYED